MLRKIFSTGLPLRRNFFEMVMLTFRDNRSTLNSMSMFTLGCPGPGRIGNHVKFVSEPIAVSWCPYPMETFRIITGHCWLMGRPLRRDRQARRPAWSVADRLTFSICWMTDRASNWPPCPLIKLNIVCGKWEPGSLLISMVRVFLPLRSNQK